MLKKFISYVATAAISLTLIACGSGSDSSGDTLVIQKPTKATTILVFGDSVSQGYGVNIYGNYYQQITPGKTYTDLLRQRIGSERLDEFASITVINASIGAETSSEALQRLPTVMGSTRPTHVILAHGTNDAAANLPLTFISDNLISMAGIVNHFGAKPLLADVTFTAFGSGYANEYTQHT
jgi:lysophospholipase L1-like esterase